MIISTPAPWAEGRRLGTWIGIALGAMMTGWLSHAYIYCISLYGESKIIGGPLPDQLYQAGGSHFLQDNDSSMWKGTVLYFSWVSDVLLAANILSAVIGVILNFPSSQKTKC